MKRCHKLTFVLLVLFTFCWVEGARADDGVIREKVDVVGELWTVEKNLNEGTTTFVDLQGNVYNEQQFIGAMHAREQATRIEPSLAARLKTLPVTQNTRIIITLKDQPYGSLIEQAREFYRPELEAIGRELQAVKERNRYSGPPLTREQEAAVTRSLPAADAELVRSNAERIDTIKGNINVLAHQWAVEATAQQQDSIASLVERFGGSVLHRYTVFNGMASIVPAGAIEQLASQPEVARTSEDQRMTAHLNVSGPSLGTDWWWIGGYTGDPFDVGILDCGVDNSHPAFSGKTFVNHTVHTTGLTDSCYNDNSASTDDLSGHGTHVAGIVMSNGSAECAGCKGVAYGLDNTFNLKAAWRSNPAIPACMSGANMYWSDMMAAVNWAEGQFNDPDIYNLSYGSSRITSYSDCAKFWDAVVAVKANPVTLSAGNEGPSNTDFSDPGNSYNSITVANMDDKNTFFRTDDKISSNSTRGPTNDDRKKPDLAAPGTNINAPHYTWESTLTLDYVQYSGTSMAAPHVAGAYTLLCDYAGFVNVSNTLKFKALLINTADSWSDNGTLVSDADDGPVDGSHWDVTYGWGYLNLDHAQVHKDDTFSANTSTTTRQIYYKGYMAQYDKATLVWNRRALYNNASTPTTVYNLTDLDLVAYRFSSNTSLISSASYRDNVEQISVASDGDVILKVIQFSDIYGASSEPFGLATEEGFIRYYGASRTGVFRPSNGNLYLKNVNSSGFADATLTYGIAGDKPITGDWDGNSTRTIGVYRNGTFYLRNSNTLGYADMAFAFGAAGDLPVAGDWDGDGDDTIGIYRNGVFFLRNSNSSGAANMVFTLGMAGDIPIAGDWTHKGYDTVGVFRPSTGVLYLKDTNTTGVADVVCYYGSPGDKPVTGDWDGNGTDTIGIYRNGVFYLRNSNTTGMADSVFALGVTNDEPISGDWLGLP